MVNLTDLGFTRGVCSETIVSTYNNDGSANAAPMGIRMQDEEHLTLDIFNTSTTCHNLKTQKAAVINLTGDADVFYKSTCKEANPDGKVPAEWFMAADAVAAPKLRSAQATIQISVVNTTESPERTTFLCKVARVNSEATYPQVYCRALPLTLEAITHATRVKVFLNQPQKQAEAAELIERIQSYAAVVGRVAPNSPYTKVFDDLLVRIDSWRAKS